MHIGQYGVVAFVNFVNGIGGISDGGEVILAIRQTAGQSYGVNL